MAKQIKLSDQVDLSTMLSFHRNCGSGNYAVAIQRQRTSDSRMVNMSAYLAAALLWELTAGECGAHTLHLELGEDKREGLIALIEMASTTKDPQVIHDATYMAIIALSNTHSDANGGEKYAAKRAFGDKRIAEWSNELFGKNSDGKVKAFQIHPTRYAEEQALAAKFAMLKAQNAPAKTEPKPAQNRKPVEPTTAIGAAMQAKTGNSKAEPAK